MTYGADRNDLKGTFVDFDLAKDLMLGIAPCQKLFLMDTCESGETDYSESGAYFDAAGSRGDQCSDGASDRNKCKKRKRPSLLHRERYI